MSWKAVVRASQLFKFQGLMGHVKENVDCWHRFYDAADPLLERPPAPWDKLEGLERIVLLRCFRLDSVSLAVRKYVQDNLGPAFTQIPPFDLSVSYGDSDSNKPLIFILSAGCDPLSKIEKLAGRMMYSDRLKTLSLGQGQGSLAEAMIVEAVKTGDWVVLQNCHLLTSWLPNLTSLWEEIISGPETHPDFRLWLTSYPSHHFPTSLLQAGIKIIVERPAGIKPNLASFYQSDLVQDPEFYSGGTKVANPAGFQRLLYSLAFFHGVVEERCNYGPVGWNTKYEFNVSDLVVSARHLHTFLASGDPPDWAALSYLTADCNYGGRITDINDRRLIISLLARFYNDQVVDTPGCSLSQCGNYSLPLDLSLPGVLTQISTLSDLSRPDPLGLHENCSLTRDCRESQALLENTLATQPQVEVLGDLEEGRGLQEEVRRLLEKVPGSLSSALEEKFPHSYHESLNTVVRLEVERYNKLIQIVRLALSDLQGALRGDIIMSLEIEDTLESVKTSQVPVTWAMAGFLCETSLEGYIDSLASRVEFYSRWLELGTLGLNNKFWFPGFFQHHSFISAIKQNFARHNNCQVDQVDFSFSVLAEGEEVAAGAYGIHGLSLEGARWDSEAGVLGESLAKVQYSPLPVIQLAPRLREAGQTEPEPGYQCPVYVSQGRCGETSTAGHNNNFIFYIPLPSNLPSSHWINRGVAALCQTDL